MGVGRAPPNFAAWLDGLALRPVAAAADANTGVSSVCPDDYPGGAQVAELFTALDAYRTAFIGRTHHGVRPWKG